MFFIMLAAIGVFTNVLAFIVNCFSGDATWLPINFACAFFCAGCLVIEVDRHER